MALTPTEREEHFFKAMVDAADGNTPEELEPTERREHWYKEIIDAIKSGGGGSGGGVLVVHQSGDDLQGYTLDKTWQEIFDADYPIIVDEDTDGKLYHPITSAFIEGQNYIVRVSLAEYGTTSANGYPKSAGGK